MNALELAFWLAAGLVAYTYFAYPVLLAVVARLWPRPVRQGSRHPRSVSFVLAVHNEETRIADRLDEIAGLLLASELEGEIIVVSDGSTDATAQLVREHGDGLVRVIELPQRVGKALALTAGWAVASHEVLVFSDVRQTWEPRALHFLLENFADPTVGAVSGDLVVRSRPGVMSGVGLYWSFEKWLRRQETKVYATVGATGAISAVRTALFRPIPAGTLLDDVYWPLRVVLQGARVVHDERARAYDHLPERPGDEFRRKVRTLAGNFQLLTRLPAALLPWANPVWLQLVSHKLLRLVVPWALLVLLTASAILPGALYRVAFWSQAACYALGLAGVAAGTRWPNRLVSAASSFLVLNTAAFAAFWVWVSGQAGRSWTKVAYQRFPVEAARAPQPRVAEHAHVDSVS